MTPPVLNDGFNITLEGPHFEKDHSYNAVTVSAVTRPLCAFITECMRDITDLKASCAVHDAQKGSLVIRIRVVTEPGDEYSETLWKDPERQRQFIASTLRLSFADRGRLRLGVSDSEKETKKRAHFFANPAIRTLIYPLAVAVRRFDAVTVSGKGASFLLDGQELMAVAKSYAPQFAARVGQAVLEIIEFDPDTGKGRFWNGFASIPGVITDDNFSAFSKLQPPGSLVGAALECDVVDTPSRSFRTESIAISSVDAWAPYPSVEFSPIPRRRKVEVRQPVA